MDSRRVSVPQAVPLRRSADILQNLMKLEATYAPLCGARSCDCRRGNHSSSPRTRARSSSRAEIKYDTTRQGDAWVKHLDCQSFGCWVCQSVRLWKRRAACTTLP